MKMIFKKRNGLSLLEVIIVIGIFSGIIFVIGSFMSGTSRFEDLVNQKLQVRQDLEQTFQVLVTEIRSMKPSASGAFPISSATSSSLSFYSDTDGDGVGERVRYSVVTSTLERGIVKASGSPLSYATTTEVKTIAVEKVVTSTFSLFEYYGPGYTGAGIPLPEPIDVTQIRVIKVALRADVSPKAPEPILFTDTINIRNLRSN